MATIMIINNAIVIFCLSTVLSVDDLPTVIKNVWDARFKWFSLGIQLGVTVDTLDSIDRENKPDPGECLVKVLVCWLQRSDPPPTWSHLIHALQTPMIGFNAVASQLTTTLEPSFASVDTPGKDIIICCNAWYNPIICARRTGLHA